MDQEQEKANQHQRNIEYDKLDFFYKSA